MRIAVLSDIHANLPALECIVRDFTARGAKEVWCLGDYLGQGPFPNEVLKKLRGIGARCIIGNHDEKILGYRHRRQRGQTPGNPAKAFSLAWTSRQLHRSGREFLAGLPQRRRMKRAGRTFLLVHGRPPPSIRASGKNAQFEYFRQFALKARADVVLFGHTHVYDRKTAQGALLLNPGSVGRPYDGDPRASYVLLDIRQGGLKVRHIRIAYDVKAVTQAMSRARFPGAFPRAVVRGRALAPAPETRGPLISRTLELARSCHYERAHAHQVARLALKLFDGLKPLHRVDERYRPLLQSAALLHDIGWIRGRAGHHKTSRDLILGSTRLPLPRRERKIVALTARYHRRALPRRTHKYYRDLPAAGRKVLDRLAALLRLADGMDRAHAGSVKDLACRVAGKTVTVRINVRSFSDEEKQTARQKADLFERTFARKVRWEYASAG